MSDCFLVTSRHVFIDADNNHQPGSHHDRDACRSGRHGGRRDVSIPLYGDGSEPVAPGGRLGRRGGCGIDRDRSGRAAGGVGLLRLYPGTCRGGIRNRSKSGAATGHRLSAGFHDALHHMPFVRRASLASSFGLRFQGMGYFLTDARTHRGSSGAPVLLRVPPSGAGGRAGLSCRLLGVHSSRFDRATRDPVEDEALGLNCAWYADILLTLSETERASGNRPIRCSPAFCIGSADRLTRADGNGPTVPAAHADLV